MDLRKYLSLHCPSLSVWEGQGARRIWKPWGERPKGRWMVAGCSVPTAAEKRRLDIGLLAVGLDFRCLRGKGQLQTKSILEAFRWKMG